MSANCGCFRCLARCPSPSLSLFSLRPNHPTPPQPSHSAFCCRRESDHDHDAAEEASCGFGNLWERLAHRGSGCCDSRPRSIDASKILKRFREDILCEGVKFQ